MLDKPVSNVEGVDETDLTENSTPPQNKNNPNIPDSNGFSSDSGSDADCIEPCETNVESTNNNNSEYTESDSGSYFDDCVTNEPFTEFGNGLNGSSAVSSNVPLEIAENKGPLAKEKDSKVMPKKHMHIEYLPNDGDKWVSAQILGRVGKATGKYKLKVIGM